MSGFYFRSPTNPAATPYITGNISDPNIPAGYVFCWSDGAYDVQQKTNVAGVNSGGYPRYVGDAAQIANQPKWPNGILTGG